MGLKCLEACASICGCPSLLSSGYHKHKDLINANAYISLDTQFMGDEAIVLKCGSRLCGTGGVLLNVPLIQNKSYFEVKIQQSGQWGIGVATRDADLSHPPLGRDFFSWVMRSSGQLYHDDKVISTAALPNQTESTRANHNLTLAKVNKSGCGAQSSELGTVEHERLGSVVNFEDGDVIGVAYDHVSLQFYLGGIKLENASFFNIKSRVYPLLYVNDDAILDIKINDFVFKPPKGFSQIMREKTIL
ncbi:SPRY domain-containing protein 7-like [Convolutriloba macropyga]|uniref:SPRY domain-containing protein 7-like n=1 Tax=Convolutriloba macropyga TaxID=536237 RepID=UPI003F51D6E9